MKRLFDGPAVPAAAAALALTLALVPGPERGQRGDHHGTPGMHRVEQLPFGAGLARGAQVAGWSVEALEADSSGRIQLTVAKHGVSFRVIVAPRGVEPHAAPRSTRTRDLFYTRPMPASAALTEAERSAVLEAVARQISAHE